MYMSYDNEILGNLWKDFEEIQMKTQKSVIEDERNRI